MEEWKPITLGRLSEQSEIAIQTGPFGSQLHAYDYVESGVAVVPTEAIQEGRIDPSVLPKITSAKAKELSRHRLKVGDILFARRGVQATGRTAIVRKAEEGFICGTGAIRLRVSEQSSVIETQFLAHLLGSQSSIDWFKFHAIGATMPNLNEGIIKSFSFLLPPLHEQRAIAATLGVLDDKIEMNRRMNETLEAMARALFRDWFVDFGPTRAKMEGRDPYLAPDLWALFPDRLNEEGKPEGWNAGTLNDLAILNPESWTARNSPDRVAYVDLANTKWGNIDAIEEYNWADAPSRARRKLRPGDTIVGTVRPGNGSFCYIGEDGLTGSTGFAVLRAKNQRDRAFIWCAATAPENIDRLAHLADGGAYPAVKPDAVSATEIIVPCSDLLEAFFEAARANLHLMERNKLECRTLATTRDLLLPRLMSGELLVTGADRAIEVCDIA
jgi:type I restriction enzyme, S subunit